MPIYEYSCKECDHQFEKLQKMSDAPLTDCPACSKPSVLQKLLSAGTSICLMGHGWYKNGFSGSKSK